MGMLRIHLFGAVQIIHNSGSPEAQATPKAQALLAYLLLQGPRYHPRERLADIFWGEYAPGRARGCLSTTLWRLRRALEPKDILSGTYLITTANDEIGFNWESDHWLDVIAFEKQVNGVLRQPIHSVQTTHIQALEKTLQLYKGDLLAGFYEDWAIQEQERLRARYLDGLEYLMRYYQQHGLYKQSLRYGQKVLAHEPTHEAIHRQLMRIYLASGQRALAVKQYETCCEILARELDLPPMEETQLLYAQAVSMASGQTVIHLNQTDWQQALKQLGLAMHHFDEAHRQLRIAKQRFDEAQQQLQHALRLVEQVRKQ